MEKICDTALCVTFQKAFDTAVTSFRYMQGAMTKESHLMWWPRCLSAGQRIGEHTAAGRRATSFVKAAMPPLRHRTPEPTMALNRLNTRDVVPAPPRRLRLEEPDCTLRSCTGDEENKYEAFGAAVALRTDAEPKKFGA